jgi:hypothetical protein
MIKMLGLLKEDMSSSQNEWAWFGYQVNRLSELESLETKLFSLFSDECFFPNDFLRCILQIRFGWLHNFRQLEEFLVTCS